MKQPIQDVVDDITERISAEIISDKSISLGDRCDALEELEDFCGEWAKHIRSENE